MLVRKRTIQRSASHLQISDNRQDHTGYSNSRRHACRLFCRLSPSLCWESGTEVELWQNGKPRRHTVDAATPTFLVSVAPKPFLIIELSGWDHRPHVWVAKAGNERHLYILNLSELFLKKICPFSRSFSVSEKNKILRKTRKSQTSPL